MFQYRVLKVPERYQVYGRLPIKTFFFTFSAFLFIFATDIVRTYAKEVDRPMILQLMVEEMVISNDDP